MLGHGMGRGVGVTCAISEQVMGVETQHWSSAVDLSRMDGGESCEASEGDAEEPRRKYPKRGAGRALYRQMSQG